MNECDKVRYRPVQQKPQEESPSITSTSGEEKEIITISNGYFDSFAGEVTEFFKHLHDPIIVE